MIDMSRKEDNKSDYIVYLDRILDNTSIMYNLGTLLFNVFDSLSSLQQIL